MSTRPYQSPRREEAARATQRAILDAAEEVFLDRGYAGATLTEIAATARVSPATVKGGFGTKGGLLAALIRTRLSDDARVPLSQTPAWRSALSHGNPEELIRAYVALSGELHARTAGLIQAVTHGASTDPELEELRSRGSAARLRDVRAVVRALEKTGALRHPPSTAADTLWALNSPDLFRQLVHARRWSINRWERLISDLLITQLLIH